MIVGLDIMNICCLIQKSDKIVIIIILTIKKEEQEQKAHLLLGLQKNKARHVYVYDVQGLAASKHSSMPKLSLFMSKTEKLRKSMRNFVSVYDSVFARQ
jgi:hypothetical protein